MKNNLVFEKCSDINENYPFLLIYLKNIDENNPFMEISINKEQDLQYILDYEYFNKNIVLSNEEWSLIYRKGHDFFIETMENSKFY